MLFRSFIETGEYSNKSFSDVYLRVYSNPDVMSYHMHGLLLSQILWQQHYEMFSFFSCTLPLFKDGIRSYLEIGGGHGLFVSEALELLNKEVYFELVDVSQSSLDMAKKFITNGKVNFVLQDIFAYETARHYDFIAMGEVLEHVEQPEALLRRVSNLLTDDGYVFITVPANAPAIDHIYLFKNEHEIRNLAEAAGFRIATEVITPPQCGGLDGCEPPQGWPWLQVV